MLAFCRDSDGGNERDKCLASKVQPEEARFEPELDWGKLWRGQVFGELEAAFGSESTL